MLDAFPEAVGSRYYYILNREFMRKKNKLGETDKRWRLTAQSSALIARKKGIR